MRYSGPYDKDLASLIEHTVMQPDVTTDIVREQCQLAMEYGLAGVCVNLVHIALAAHEVHGSKLTVCTGIGFPLGASGYLLKATETRDAVASGADEIDMVINVGAVKQGDYRTLEREIQAVKDAADGRIVKVLLEICYLSNAEIEKVCRIAAEQGADFVKTSTGFGKGVAAPHAKIDDLPRVVAAVGRSSHGIDFASLDGELVYGVFLILSPSDDAEQHLRAMDLVFRHLQQERFRKFLRQSDSAEKIYDLLKEVGE